MIPAALLADSSLACAADGLLVVAARLAQATRFAGCLRSVAPDAACRHGAGWWVIR